MAKHKNLPEAVVCGHIRIPFDLLDSSAYIGASHRAQSLLVELVRQLNGINNGHLHLTTSWLKKRGWKSVDQIQKGKLELLERGLIFQTKQGGLNFGPNLYAVTWLHITNCTGLDISGKDYHPGKWRFMDPVFPEKARNKFRGAVQQKNEVSSTIRNRAFPQGGTTANEASPSHGTKTSAFGNSSIPSNGNNVITITHRSEQHRIPIVGGQKEEVAKTDVYEKQIHH